MIYRDSLTNKTYRLVHPSIYLAARRAHVLDYRVQFDALGWSLQHVPSEMTLLISAEHALHLIQLMSKSMRETTSERIY